VPFNLSMGEILVVLFVALLVFGGKLPDAARKLGSALSEFKRGMNEEMRRLDDGMRSDAPAPEWRPPATEPQEGAAKETTPPAS
jgi:TatA/E family protein of Tat protein translocase